MEITETIKRECCDARKDLVHIFPKGAPSGHQYYACKHCRRHWVDVPGQSDMELLPWPWKVNTTAASINTTAASLDTKMEE